MMQMNVQTMFTMLLNAIGSVLIIFITSRYVKEYPHLRVIAACSHGPDIQPKSCQKAIIGFCHFKDV